eukprot:TRINITY_DN1593_c0_g2_i1.p2 TRINITY_DN1593_c0_g2~~TRINITY_DN1593_c0_g2_i1.p2  ORF type:complete len:365 (+),score=89.46 TRINITY_DN1593_c0_g2_i1:162-1256(+)
MAVGSRLTLKEQRQRRARARRREPQSVEQLYQRGMYAMDIQDYGSAENCFERAAGLAPSNHIILEAFGSLLAEIGKRDRAAEVLLQAVELAPNSGYEKYMYLGQLLEGESGILHLRKGIQLIKEQLPVARQLEEQNMLKSAYCCGLCALSEQLMQLAGDLVRGGDQSINAAVIQECDALLREARNVDNDSPEPIQALASLRYEQGLAEEAMALLKESMGKWFKGKPRKIAGDGERQKKEEEEEEEEVNDDDDDDEVAIQQPSYEFRFECAKLLLELDDNTDTVIQVLEGLLREDERVPHVWQLLAMSYYGGNMLDEADEVTTQAIKAIKSHPTTADDDGLKTLQELQEAITEAKSNQQNNDSCF